MRNAKWERMNNLCWEGFDKVIQYASKHYPAESNNKSLELFMNKYDGNWDSKINKITETHYE